MKLTPWFPPSAPPERDGVYITRAHLIHGGSECWFAMRWHGYTSAWYAADTTGSQQSDVIGWDRPNHHKFDWRGLAEKPE